MHVMQRKPTQVMIHQFSFGASLLWSGRAAEVSTVTSICSSMLKVGFKQEEVVVIRNRSHKKGGFLFSDGMKREDVLQSFATA